MRTVNIFLGNVFLPLVWMALTGTFTLVNFIIGLLLGTLVLSVAFPRDEVVLLVYLARLCGWVSFFLFFLGELIFASLRVVHDILTPRHRMRPAIIAVPLETDDPLAITVLASFLTMTPGTLTLEVAPERDVLFVHAMYVHDIEDFRQRVRGYEKRVRRLLQ